MGMQHWVRWTVGSLVGAGFPATLEDTTVTRSCRRRASRQRVAYRPTGNESLCALGPIRSYYLNSSVHYMWMLTTRYTLSGLCWTGYAALGALDCRLPRGRRLFRHPDAFSYAPGSPRHTITSLDWLGLLPSGEASVRLLAVSQELAVAALHPT